MNRVLKFSLLAVVSVVLACSFSACSNNDNGGTDVSAKDAQFQDIAKQYLNNTVLVTYHTLADDTELLVKKLENLKTNKTDANVQDACNTFLEARMWWEKSEAFLFGAAKDFGIDPHIDSWPLDLDGLLTALKNAEQVKAMAGNDGDAYAGDKLGNSLLGFHGIEYILFKDGKPKSASEITDLQMIYAVAVAGDLRNRCYQLELSWAGEDAVVKDRVSKIQDLDLPYTLNSGTSYSKNMLNAGQAGSTYSSWTAAMQAIIDGCKDISDEVGTSKIGKPHNGEDVNYIESPYSHNSITDFYDNITSVQNSYMGGIDGQRNENLSIHAYIRSIDADLDTRTVKAIDNALAKIKAMKAPFVNNYTDTSAGEAINACKALDDILSEVKTALQKN